MVNFQPANPSTIKGLDSRVAAGLVLWKDKDNYLVFQRREQLNDEGKEIHQAVLEEIVGADARERPTGREPRPAQSTCGWNTRGDRITGSVEHRRGGLARCEAG